MARIGNVTRSYHEGDEVKEWRVPVQVFMTPQARELDVIEIYEDEGVLVIDVAERERNA